MIASRGKLLLGARPLAQHILDDEEKFRSVYNEDLQRELGGIPPQSLRPARSRGAGLFDSSVSRSAKSGGHRCKVLARNF